MLLRSVHDITEWTSYVVEGNGKHGVSGTLFHFTLKTPNQRSSSSSTSSRFGRTATLRPIAVLLPLLRVVPLLFCFCSFRNTRSSQPDKYYTYDTDTGQRTRTPNNFQPPWSLRDDAADITLLTPGTVGSVSRSAPDPKPSDAVARCLDVGA